jgi:hypothetical protein
MSADDWDNLIAWVCGIVLVAYLLWAVIDPIGFVNYGL